jgi:hypothetical protein
MKTKTQITAQVIEPLTIRLLAFGTFAVQLLSSIIFIWFVRR